MKDVIIIGGGPAGMSAAIYAHGAGLGVGIIEKSVFGGQMASSSVIENYPGVGRTTGYELSASMKGQVDSCGIEPVYDTVRKIEAAGESFRVVCDMGEHYGRAVIIANGVTRREAGFRGEREYLGRGVSYCAVCDGAFFRGRDVCVIGGGSSALEEAAYLSRICGTVHLVHRRDTFRADEKYVKEVQEKANIVFHMSHVPTAVWGEGRLEGIEICENGSGETRRLSVSGVFVAVGLVPDNVRFADALRLTRDGYIDSDESCTTSREGIFVCGDTRAKKVRQIVTAVSDGAVAATRAAEYLRGRI